MDYSEMVSFLWEKQEFLRSHYKKNKYGTVILPFVTLARLDAELQPTKPKVLEKISELKRKGMKIGSGMDEDLNKITKKNFNNKSEFESLQDLLSEQKDVKSNLEDYIKGFSKNILDIFERFKFSDVINDLEKKNLLWKAVEHFARYTRDLAKIDNHKMGTIYEELIRKANEASHETAGDHFTPRDVIDLMVALIFSPDEEGIVKNPQRIRVIYDPACGTGGMLSQAAHFLEEEVSGKPNLGLVGQDINDEAYAMCKSDMMIRGIDPEYIQFGNSLTSQDHFKALKFDYMLSNPPYGKDWKDFAEEIEEEYDKKGGRYDVGLPRKTDGSLLFLQHMISKMHPKESGKVSRIAIVFNASPLVTGEAGSGESEIRKWILKPENDYLETIISLPKDLFYNTGIYTYIWILTNNKSAERVGKVQLINAINKFDKMRRSLSNKRNDISKYIREIVGIYKSFPEQSKECKIFRIEEFGYTRIKVNRPLRRNFNFSDERIERVKQEPSFVRLAESNKKGSAQLKEENEGKELQQKIIQSLQKQDKLITYTNCQEFGKRLSQIMDNEKIKIKSGVLSAIQHALSDIDESAPPCKGKQGKVIFDPDLQGYENIPFSQDIHQYFEKEVLEYVKDAEYDSENHKIGYEIPFTRYFYEYKPLRKIEDIESDIIKVEEKIRLLTEKRQVTIDQAVTRGLNQRAPMKKTGIKWIGDIPEHWKLNKIKFTSYVKGRIGWQGLRSDEFTDVGPYLITGTEFKDGKVNWEKCHHVETWRYEQDLYIQIKNDDILITKDGTIGKVALIENIPGPTTLNSGVLVIRPLRKSYLPRFMYWVLQSEQFIQYVEYTKTGATIKHLYQETFENLTFTYPASFDEQKQISDYLERRVRKIDNTISQIQEMVKLLREKRRATIASVVPGY